MESENQRKVHDHGHLRIRHEAKLYTVKKGDSLSKIAKELYGDAQEYAVIFEANKPMLKDANLICPGQVLRIPTPPK